MLFYLLASATAGTLSIDMLDVGQGDSVLLTTARGAHILVDAGTSRAGVADTLERMGVDRIDVVIASHPHADHIGGIAEVIERFPVGAYYHSGDAHTTRTYRNLEETIRAKRIEHKEAKAGQSFDLGDGAVMKVLWPGTMRLEGTRSDLNSNSVVLRIQNEKDCILLMGDAEEPTEDAILRHHKEPCGLLKVAHHGSNHSSSQQFLNAIQPKIALISAGEDNRYRHPGNETLRKLHRMDTTVYRTDLTGHITVLSTGNGFEVVDGLADSAPTELPRVVTPEPLTEFNEPDQPPPSKDSTDEIDVKSVEESKEAVDSSDSEALSLGQRLLNWLRFWKR